MPSEERPFLFQDDEGEEIRAERDAAFFPQVALAPL